MTTDELTALRRLVDKDKIIDLVHRYSYCVNHRRYDDVVELFTEDCIVDYGPGNPPVRSRVALRKLLGHPEAGFKATSHHNANVLVTFGDDDNATVLTSVYAWHERKNGTTPRLWGYYDDTVASNFGRLAHRKARTPGPRGRGWHSNWHWALEKEVGELQ